MTHRTVESWLTQAARMSGSATRKHQTDTSLGEFGKSAAALLPALYQDRLFDQEEFLLMYSPMQVLQMTYLRWKRKHVGPDNLHSMWPLTGPMPCTANPQIHMASRASAVELVRMRSLGLVTTIDRNRIGGLMWRIDGWGTEYLLHKMKALVLTWEECRVNLSSNTQNERAT